MKLKTLKNRFIVTQTDSGQHKIVKFMDLVDALYAIPENNPTKLPPGTWLCKKKAAVIREWINLVKEAEEINQAYAAKQKTTPVENSAPEVVTGE